MAIRPYKNILPPLGPEVTTMQSRPSSAQTPRGWAVVVGDDVTVGHQCIIHGCTVESRCLIGMGLAIFDGAILRGGVSLGAGNLVTEGKDLTGGYLWMGRPVRKVRVLTEAEKACFEYTAKH